ncbi:radical SAM protein [Sorangium sp. So ce726]|uniref:B12-binding domain-containing radical SAM protein n=1 Tax=Sorangium sp. So ce726 TaxID=3133319 RepID=UPI003F5EE1C6
MGVKVLFIVKEIEGAEPLGALYVAGCLEQAGHECKFIGTRGNDVLAEVRRYGPDVIAFGATTGLHRYYLGLNHHIKQHYPKAVSLMGGPHATYYPEVIQTPGLDVVCQGEGEDAAVELCDALARGDDHRGIRDLWVKSEGKIYRNPARELRRDLDAIPFPSRHLLYEYDDSLRRRPLKSFTTNRGCPFPCSYCFNPSLVEHYGSSWKKVRIRSPQNVVAELVHVMKQGPLQFVGFRESIFVYDAEWLRQFGELYRREVKLPYYCHLRADMMTEEMVDLLAWSGCYTVNVGIETANPELANGVLRRQIRMDRLVHGIRLLKRAGIVVFADNILGIPGGTLEDDLATLELNIELDVDYAAATLCTPYPGTGIAAYAVEHGHFSGDFDLIDDSYYTESVLRFSSDEEKRQIENLHKVFAVTAAIPALLPLVRRLIRLPPNDFFYAMFRAWYLVCHMTDVMPRRLELAELVNSALSIFGVYRGADENRYPAPAPEALPVVAPPAQAACGDTRTIQLRRRPRIAAESAEAPDVR